MTDFPSGMNIEQLLSLPNFRTFRLLPILASSLVAVPRVEIRYADSKRVLHQPYNGMVFALWDVS
jgi:hypothetical protein